MFIGDFIIKNEGIEQEYYPRDDFEIQVYEVIRLINGIPVFYDEHYDRFVESCRTANITVGFTRKWLAKKVVHLAKMNSLENCNLKYFYNVYANNVEFYAGFIKSSYPDQCLYNTGVQVGILFEERTNPSAKLLNTSIKNKADNLIVSHGFYEVALVNRLGEITEGSRSNLFFIADDSIYTAPSALVLSGVTRKVIIEEIKQLGYPLIESTILLDDLDRFRAAFISGTSPSVLPIALLNSHEFEVPNYKAVMIGKAYQSRILDDIIKFRNRYHL